MTRGGQGPKPQSGERKPKVRPRSRQRNLTAKARAQPRSVAPDLIGRGEANCSQLPLSFSPASVAAPSMSFEALHRSVILVLPKSLSRHGASGAEHLRRPAHCRRLTLGTLSISRLIDRIC